MIWPATPSAKPNLAKILKAIASLCLRYFRSSYLSSKDGGPDGTPFGIVRLGSPLLYMLSLAISGIVECAMLSLLKDIVLKIELEVLHAMPTLATLHVFHA